jgi:Undecaprenyl-phosphate glucose phosphotransferase
MFLAAAFFAKLSIAYSRIWTISWTVFALSLILSQRALLSFLLASWADRFLKLNVVVVGADETLNRVVARLQAFPDEINICGVFSDKPYQARSVECDYTITGDIDDLIQSAPKMAVDHIILAVPLHADGRIKMLASLLKQLSSEVLITVDQIGEIAPILGLRHIGGLPLLEIVDRPIKHWGAVAKWIEDKILGSLILIVTGPLLLLVALLIKWDSQGPVFFIQERHGFNNRIIRVIKFRTMHVHVEDRSGEQRTTRHDPRVTRVGRILRRLSLDELPQLINVLRGEMSLVGPRPHAVAMKVGGHRYCDAVAEYAQRHRVKPGLTGWAQINGLRGEVNSLEKGHVRIQYDLYYIERWSIWFDLKILALTVPAVLSTRDAF